MPISNRQVRRHAAGALFALSAVIIVACGAAGECFRFSDCAQGLTCASGMCVVPGQPSDGDTTEGDGATTTTGADTGSSTVITPSSSDATTDAGVDAGTDATSE